MITGDGGFSIEESVFEHSNLISSKSCQFPFGPN